MENQIKFSRAEVLKWIVILAIIASAYFSSQIDINYLKQENRNKTIEIQDLKEQMKLQGECVKNMNGKLSNIQTDVTIIKNAVIK